MSLSRIGWVEWDYNKGKALLLLQHFSQNIGVLGFLSVRLSPLLE
jgi:hypothetical protein